MDRHTMASDRIVIRGAREHNLKNVDLEIPRDQLVVITGLSGSGKSTLAFDTIYAEGQRRYVESLSAYARQFLGLMEKPDVDSIEGLSPAISIEQKTTSRNPRSTVGTVTEIYDYLRVLYARVGTPHCPQCGQIIAAQTVQQMVDRVRTLPAGTRVVVLAPVVRGRKGEYRKLVFDLRRQGFARVRVNGTVRDLSEDIELDLRRRVKRRQIVEVDTMADGLGLVEIDLRDLGQCEIALAFLGGADFAFHGITGAKAEAADHARSDVNVVRAREIIRFGRAQEAEAVIQNLDRPRTHDLGAGVGADLEDGEHEVLLAQCGCPLDAELFGHGDEFGRGLFLEVFEMHMIWASDEELEERL